MSYTGALNWSCFNFDSSRLHSTRYLWCCASICGCLGRHGCGWLPWPPDPPRTGALGVCLASKIPGVFISLLGKMKFEFSLIRYANNLLLPWTSLSSWFLRRECDWRTWQLDPSRTCDLVVCLDSKRPGILDSLLWMMKLWKCLYFKGKPGSYLFKTSLNSCCLALNLRSDSASSDSQFAFSLSAIHWGTSPFSASSSANVAILLCP